MTNPAVGFLLPFPEAQSILWADLKLVVTSSLALLAILSCGRFLLALLGQPFEDRTEAGVFSWTLGCLAVSVASLGIAFFGLIYPGVFFALALVALLGGRGPWRAGNSPSSSRERACLLLGAIYAAIYLVAALAPEVSTDAVAYHLGLLRLFMASHRMVHVPEMFGYSLPQGMGMVYLFCASLGGYSVARLAHLGCLVALALAVRSFGRRIGCPGGGAVAAAAVFSSSLFGAVATTAYVDVALALAVFLTFYAAYSWRESWDRRFLWMAGLMGGFAMSIKPTGTVALLILAAAVLWPGVAGQGRGQAFGRRLRAALLCATLAVVIYSPWPLRSWVVFGNPLMPFANRLFPNPYLLPSSEAAFLKAVRHPGGFGENRRDYLNWPLEVTIGGTRLQGFLGPFFLLAPLALAAAGKREGRWLLVAGLMAGLPVAGNVLTRFLMPALPFFALAIVLGVEAVVPAGAARRLLGLALVAHGVMNLPWVIARRSETVHFALQEVPVRAAFRLESERDYLQRKLEYFPAMEFLEKETPPGARVLAFVALHQAYTSRLLLQPLASEFTRGLVRALSSAADPALAPERRVRARFAPVKTRALRLFQSRSSPHSYWSIYELEVIGSGGRPLAFEDFRFRAGVNPFEASLAADGRPYTGWYTGAPLEAGTWFQVDLGREREVQEIRYVVPPKEGTLLPELLVSPDGEQWTPWPAQFDSAGLPPRNWRSEAVTLVQSKGVDYVLLANRPDHPYAPLFADLLERSREWGLREVFRSGQAVILKREP